MIWMTVIALPMLYYLGYSMSVPHSNITKKVVYLKLLFYFNMHTLHTLHHDLKTLFCFGGNNSNVGRAKKLEKLS